MKRTIGLAAALVWAPMTAMADAEQVIERLSATIVAVDLCGISIDTDAMVAHMAAEIDAGDLDFSSSLRGRVNLDEILFADITGVEKTLHCAQVRRNAEHYGWLKTD